MQGNLELKRTKYDMKYQKDYYDEDEIDLYELFLMLIKHKILILAVFSICTIGAIITAKYKRNTTPNKDAMNISLNLEEISRNFDYNPSKVIDFKNVFEKDENVKKIYEIEDIKKEYEKSFGSDNKNISAMKNFLKNNLSVVPVWEKLTFEEKKNHLSYFKIETEMKIDKKSREIFINKYLELLEQEIKLNLAGLIEKRYQFEERKMLSADSLLKKEEGYKKEAAFELYLEANKKSLILKELKDQVEKEKIIQKKSTLYTIKNKDKSALIIAIGMILGIMSGIFLALFKEFIEEYIIKYKAIKNQTIN